MGMRCGERNQEGAIEAETRCFLRQGAAIAEEAKSSGMGGGTGWE